jgi:hypothetical protein
MPFVLEATTIAPSDVCPTANLISSSVLPASNEGVVGFEVLVSVVVVIVRSPNV